SFASETEPKGQSVEELLPFLEDMLGQIERSKEIPGLIAAGPHVIPDKVDETQESPRVQILKVAPKTDRLPVPTPTPEDKPKLLTMIEFDARFNGIETTPILPVEEKPVNPPVEIFTPTPPAAEVVDTVQGGDDAPVVTPKAQPEADVTVAGDGTACTSCGPKATNLSFMQCNSRNNYLETEMKGLKNGQSLISDLLRTGPQKDNWLKNECLRSSMVTKLGENNNSFRSCPAGSDKASKTRIRPCVSENYFSLISNSFDLVTRCMAPLMGSNQKDQKREVLELFGMFHIESGMHMSAMSSSGAAGFGQLTESAIQSINKNELSGIRKVLKEQGGACTRLSTEYLSGTPPMRSQVSKSCDRISMAKGNPLTNMIYSIANVMQSKRYLNGDIINSSRLKERFDLSASERKRLLTAISVWSHNTGLGGMKTPLLALLNSTYRGNKKVTDVDKFLKELKQAMLDYPHRANKRTKRKKETSAYYPSIKSAIQSMNKNVGGGSCLN
ncbi:MAG: hypothetical protein KF789_02960, partial [Bdellovibrionaceae bacterium]|nr:hypothetical protein [Pseudobdellovibrionaceae bacterium]